MKKQDIINEKFLNLINSIFNSYTFLASDREELRNASLELETEMYDVYSQAKAYKEGKISLDDFKRVLINIVTKETDQLIVVDEDKNEISDEQKALQNYLAINAYDKRETEKFTTDFYRILASARMFVHSKLNNNASFFVASRGNIMPSNLDFFVNEQPATTNPTDPELTL